MSTQKDEDRYERDPQDGKALKTSLQRVKLTLSIKELCWVAEMQSDAQTIRPGIVCESFRYNT